MDSRGQGPDPLDTGAAALDHDPAAPARGVRRRGAARAAALYTAAIAAFLIAALVAAALLDPHNPARTDNSSHNNTGKVAAVISSTAFTSTPPATNRGGPVGPGGDAEYLTGSEAEVPGCTAWLDATLDPSLVTALLTATLSPGDASCEAVINLGTGTTPPAPNQSVKAADYAQESSATYLNSGSTKQTIQICVWNQDAATDINCSPVFLTTNGTITRE